MENFHTLYTSSIYTTLGYIILYIFIWKMKGNRYLLLWLLFMGGMSWVMSYIVSYSCKVYHKYILKKKLPIVSMKEFYHPSFEQYYENHCQICLEPFQEKESIMELKCGCQIIYHMECLSTWLEQEMTCPMCKISLYELMR